MKKYSVLAMVLSFLLVVIMTNTLMISCSDDDDDISYPTPTATPTSLPQAEIIIYSDPDPVPYSHTDSLGNNYWPFTFYVDERAGISATLQEWRYEMYSMNDELLGVGTHTIDEFIEWFDDCDYTGDGSIRPNGSYCCSSYVYWSGGNEEGWYAIDIMRFIDANGNNLWVSGRFTFLPIPG